MVRPSPSQSEARMAEPIIIVTENSELVPKLKSLIESKANRCLENNGIFNIGLSGGSLVNLLVQALPDIKTQWKYWRFFLCDERIVSWDDPESTYGLYKNNLIGAIPVNEDQFFKVNPQLSVEEAAVDYQNQLKTHFENELPDFDLLLLGLGPDGHTCSLFPGSPVLAEDNLWVARVKDSPKPPPSRITLTFPVINNAKNCMFVLSGEAKADIIKKILVDKEDLPASRVKPVEGKLYWLMDKEAAKYLPPQLCS